MNPSLGGSITAPQPESGRSSQRWMADNPAYNVDNIVVGRSARMRAVFDFVRVIADSDSSVLVVGETGTGKELIANLIHQSSSRRHRPFVPVSCAILSETLIESELFGHERGAFTGAIKDRPGRFELAQGGTIFLDDIDDVPLTMQVKLLRVLQERRFRRLGGTEEIEADIRVVAATNRDLQKEIAEGRFREDLFYRINVIPIELPPLRERGDDATAIAEHFVHRFAQQMGKRITGISRAALELVDAYDWPGNIRELENAMERAVALEATPAILPDSLPEAVRRGGRPALSLAPPTAPAPLPLDSGFSLEQHVARVERDYIAEALRKAQGVRTRAAELLGMSFRSFRYYAKKYDL